MGSFFITPNFEKKWDVSAPNLYRQGHTRSMTAHPFGYPNLLPDSLH
jgi:hypothetical protein